MTLEDIEAIPGEILKPADIAPYLRCAQYSINCAAKAGQLPYAYMVGTRVKIPKRAFINYHKYGTIEVKGEDKNV